MTSRKYRTLRSAGILAVALSACGSEESTDPLVRHDVVLLDHTSQALLDGTIQSINGTYGPGCEGRDGMWSIATDPDVVVSNELSVLQLEYDECVLFLTQVVAGPEGGPMVTYEADDRIMLGAEYTEAEFSVAGGPEMTELYGSARLFADETETADFVLEFAFSESPRFDVETVPESPPP